MSLLRLCECVEFADEDPSEKGPCDRLRFAHLIRHGPIQPAEDFTSVGSDIGPKFKSEWYAAVLHLHYGVGL